MVSSSLYFYLSVFSDFIQCICTGSLILKVKWWFFSLSGNYAVPPSTGQSVRSSFHVAPLNLSFARSLVWISEVDNCKQPLSWSPFLQPPLMLRLTCVYQTRASPGRPILTKSLSFKSFQWLPLVHRTGELLLHMVQPKPHHSGSALCPFKAALLPMPYNVKHTAGSCRCHQSEFWCSQRCVVISDPEGIWLEWAKSLPPEESQSLQQPCLMQETMPRAPMPHSPEAAKALSTNAIEVLGVRCLFYVSVHRAPMPEKQG